MTTDVPEVPNIWTDGSRDQDLDALIGVGGAGAFAHSVPWVFNGRAWGHPQDLDIEDDASRFCLGPWPIADCAQG